MTVVPKTPRRPGERTRRDRIGQEVSTVENELAELEMQEAELLADREALLGLTLAAVLGLQLVL
jgi:hypothetical protein